MLSVVRRLVAFFRRNRLDDDLAEEILLHLELRKQALVEDGMAPADADREARRQFGNVTVIRERTRAQWGGSSIDTLIHDVRYGLRLIRKAPGFSAVAIASLAVGIGASTVLFSFANTLLFRPLHAASPEQLIQLFTSNSSGSIYGGREASDRADHVARSSRTRPSARQVSLDFIRRAARSSGPLVSRAGSG